MEVFLTHFIKLAQVCSTLYINNAQALSLNSGSFWMTLKVMKVSLNGMGCPAKYGTVLPLRTRQPRYWIGKCLFSKKSWRNIPHCLNGVLGNKFMNYSKGSLCQIRRSFCCNLQLWSVCQILQIMVQPAAVVFCHFEHKLSPVQHAIYPLSGTTLSNHFSTDILNHALLCIISYLIFFLWLITRDCSDFRPWHYVLLFRVGGLDIVFLQRHRLPPAQVAPDKEFGYFIDGFNVSTAGL